MRRLVWAFVFLQNLIRVEAHIKNIIFSLSVRNNINTLYVLKYWTDQSEQQTDLDQQIGDLDNKVADLEAENEALKEERTILKERVKVWENCMGEHFQDHYFWIQDFEADFP